MADTPTPPGDLHKSSDLRGERHQTSKQIPAWSSSWSPRLQFPPTPTKDTQDNFAPPLNRFAMAPESETPHDTGHMLSPSQQLSHDHIRAIVEKSVADKKLAAERRKAVLVSKPPLKPLLVTPPISPDSPTVNAINQAPVQTSNDKDPILYPGGSENPDGAPSALLFTPIPDPTKVINPETERQLVDQHIASRPAALFRQPSWAPTREDYHLALYFVSNCYSLYQADPKRWLHQERELLRADRNKRAGHPAKLPEIRPAATKPALLGVQTRNKTIAPARVQKPAARKPKPAAKAQQPPRPIRATPTTNTTVPTGYDLVIEVATRKSTPEPRARPVAASREDKDFASLADLCPPLSTLDGQKKNSMRVDWKGNALDLSTDPHRGLLHPDELALASSLRLDCATYLTSKRRIFIRRLECARLPKEFRKTDAQQACKIDVNKASKLWQAYENVGWLDVKWIQRFL